MSLAENLAEFSIDTILIADDKPENLEAACKFLQGEIPNLVVHFFSSAKDIMGEIAANPSQGSLVITDRTMETENAGDDVFALATGLGIFTIVATGFDHHGSCTYFASLGQNGVQVGDKSDPLSWSEGLNAVFNQLDYDNVKFSLDLRRQLSNGDKELAKDLGRKSIDALGLF